MNSTFAPQPHEIRSYLTYDQTLITSNDTQQFLHESERRQNSVNEATSAATVDRICRNCGRELASITQDVCSNSRACEERATFAMPRLRAEQSDMDWSVSMFEQYVHDPRTQIVMDRHDPQEPERTKAPNLISVMRAIAAGVIQEIDEHTRLRARRFCDDMHGV